MAKPVNRKLIGGFVVLAVGIMAASVAIFGSGEYFRAKTDFVVYFEESVKGLNVGAPVLFRGVQIGQVKTIILRSYTKDLKFTVPVIVEIYPQRFQFVTGGLDVGSTLEERIHALIEKGLRAQLVSLSLITGQLAIEVEMHLGTPAVMRKGEFEQKYIEIPTIPSTLARLGEALDKLDLKDLEAHLQSALAGADRLLNSPDLTAAIHEFKGVMQDARGLLQNVNGKVDTLAGNLNRTIDDADKLVRNVDGQVKPLSDIVQATLSQAQKAIEDADKLVRNVDGQVKPLSDSVQATLGDAQKAIIAASKDLHALLGDSDKLVLDLDSQTLPLLNQALVSVDNLVGDNSDTRYKLNQALDAIAAASKSLGALMDYLEQHPEGLLKGKGGK